MKLCVHAGVAQTTSPADYPGIILYRSQKDKDGTDYFSLERSEDRDPHAIGRWAAAATRRKKRVEL